MKQINNKTILKQGDKTYQPIEVDGVIYWVDIDGVKEWSDWSYNPNTPTPRQVFYRVTEHFMPHGDKVVAQSQPKLKGIPVISLDSYVKELAHQKMMNYLTNGNPDGDFKRSTVGADDNKNWWINGYKSNPNQHTQKDIEKALFLGAELRDGIYKIPKEEIFEQINSISVIEVDEQFNIISYE